MRLPKDLEFNFRKKVISDEENNIMTRTMIPFEEVAFEEGREEGREEGMLAQAQEAILEFIAARFDIMPFSLETAR